MALSSKNDKRIKTLNCVKTFAYGTSKDIIYINEEINKKCWWSINNDDYVWCNGKRKHYSA